MSGSFFGTSIHQVFGASTFGSRCKERRPRTRRFPALEHLEGRALLASITASAVISSTPAGPNFDYTIDLSNSSSSTTSIGTFWYAWTPQPFQDLLATKPVSVSAPAGWTDEIINVGSSDGFSIEFNASGIASVPAGTSLDFGFTSPDTLASVNGNSPFYPGTPVGTSFVYSQDSEGGTSDEFVVTQAATLQSIAVTPANTSLATGQTEQFAATGTLSNDTTENLTNQVTWSSSDTTWATINSTGLATAVSPGPVTISAAFDGITGSTGLTIVAPPTLQSITVTPANTSLPTGETEQFTATGTLSNDTTENLTSQVTWTSSDTTWATINSTGLATAVSPGPVTISAAFDGITDSTGLTIVAPPTLQSITVTPANTSLPTGETEQFTAIGTLSNNTTENLTSQVTWASSDITWATINSTGLASAVSPGPVTISAAFDGITSSTGLTVNPAAPTTPSPVPTDTAISGAQPLVVRALNKKGKPVGKPVLSGFALDSGIALSAAAALNTGEFQVDTITTKRVKKKVVTTLHPIKNFTVSYVAASDAIEIKLGGKQTFPTGGQITVVSGLTTAAGGTLSGPAVFTISKGGKSIKPS